MLIEFKDLELQGSFIREIRFVPSQSVRIEVRTIPGTGEKQESILYELAFDQVHSFGASIDAQPWLEIRSHRIVSPSDYRQHYLTRQSQQTNRMFVDIDAELSDFQLILEEGQIDIVAEHVKCSVIAKVPVIESSKRPSGSPAYSLPEVSRAAEESSEIRCAFCGREQAEVPKIITGSEGNICRDCVMICVDLIAENPKNSA